MVDRAVQYLRTPVGAEDGCSRRSQSGDYFVGYRCLDQSGRPVDDPMVKKALTFIEGFVREDGGIHQDGSLYRN